MVILIRVWIRDHFFSFSSPLRNRGFLDIISHTVTGRFVAYLHGEMTDANKIMHPQHFGTRPTDPDPD